MADKIDNEIKKRFCSIKYAILYCSIIDVKERNFESFEMVY
jgi:hypothetical protein